MLPTPIEPRYFDYPAAAVAAKVSGADLSKLVRLFEADYPHEHDLMLRELHILRACHAIARGTTTLESMLMNSQERAA